jgi:glycosyltransferase involved in cell wall biosynthesis
MSPAMPVREAFAKAGIVVIPSRAEAMPYIVLEALAAEKTVIASRVGGIPEVLGPGSAALVEPGNATALASVMATALATPEWASRTMPPQESFKSRFSASVMAAQVEDLYFRQLDKV